MWTWYWRIGATVVPLTLTVLSTLPPADTGIGSALISSGQQIGASVGLAALGTIAAGIISRSTAGGTTALADGYRVTFYVTSAVLAAAFLITSISLKSGR